VSGRADTLKDARRYAAIRLAEAHGKLREAADQLAALGKEIAATPTGERGTVFERDGDLAVKRVAAYQWARGEVERVEADYRNLTEALEGEGEGEGDQTDRAIAAREHTRRRLEGGS
jgi:hypothetical protein